MSIAIEHRAIAEQPWAIESQMMEDAVSVQKVTKWVCKQVCKEWATSAQTNVQTSVQMSVPQVCTNWNECTSVQRMCNECAASVQWVCKWVQRVCKWVCKSVQVNVLWVYEKSPSNQQALAVKYWTIDRQALSVNCRDRMDSLWGKTRTGLLLETGMESVGGKTWKPVAHSLNTHLHTHLHIHLCTHRSPLAHSPAHSFTHSLRTHCTLICSMLAPCTSSQRRRFPVFLAKDGCPLHFRLKMPGPCTSCLRCQEYSQEGKSSLWHNTCVFSLIYILYYPSFFIQCNSKFLYLHAGAHHPWTH